MSFGLALIRKTNLYNIFYLNITAQSKLLIPGFLTTHTKLKHRAQGLNDLCDLASLD